MSKHEKTNPGDEFSRLRDQFERLARDFATKPLRAIVTFSPRDERSPEERDEDSDFRSQSVWLKSPTNPAARKALMMIAEEVEAALEARGETRGPGRTPAERWLLRIANARPWRYPLLHGEWTAQEMTREMLEQEETTVEIDDVFRASALAIERIATADRSPRVVKAEKEALALSLFRDHPEWTKAQIAEEMGLPDSSFLSRSAVFQRAWKTRRQT